jgi:hypothetical protein
MFDWLPGRKRYKVQRISNAGDLMMNRLYVLFIVLIIAILTYMYFST